MLSKTRTKSTKKSSKSNMSSKGWACCKCSNFNVSRHHVCHGVLLFQDDYDKPCNHWHCPTCQPLDGENPTHPGSRASDSTIPAPPDDYTPYPSPHSNHQAHQTHPHHHPLHPFRPLHRHHPSHPAHPPQQQQQDPYFSYTTAYLQSAASRGTNTVTFAEAFPAPERVPCIDPVMSLASLRLDYSCGSGGGGGGELLSGDVDVRHRDNADERYGGAGWHGDGNGNGDFGWDGEGDDDGIGRDGGDEEEEEGCPGWGGGDQGWYGDREKEKELHLQRRGERDIASDEREKKKRKIDKGKERERVVVVGAGGGKKKDKGKGKAKVGCAWGQAVYPVGYQPVTVEDVADGEGIQRYGYAGGMEEEW